MKKRFLSLAAAAVLATGFAASASAATIFVPLTAPTAAGDTSAFTGSFSATISSTGSFTEDIVFYGLPSTSTDSFSLLAGNGISFSGISLSPYASSSTIGLSSSLTSTSITASTAGQIISGTYDLKITGTAAAGSKFTGSISALVGGIATPVPEPGTYALMMAGLALLTLASRRRANRGA